MTTIIMVGSAKGGVGKTTTSSTLSMILASRGYKVLLVDFDAQANSSSYGGIPKGHGLYNLLVNGAEFDDVVSVVDPARYGASDTGALYVLPTSDRSNWRIEQDIQDEMVVPDRFSEISQLGIDFVFIDTTPSFSTVHIGFMFAANWLLTPSTCAKWSLDGADSTLGYLREVHSIAKQKLQNAPGLLGVLPTLYEQRKRVQREALDEMQDRYGQYLLPPIHLAKHWEEAVLRNLSVVLYAPRSKAAKEALALTDFVESRQVVTHE